MVAEVALDPRGDAVPHGVPLGGLCEERLEVVLDQGIEGASGWDAGAGRRAHGSAPWANAVGVNEGLPVHGVT